MLVLRMIGIAAGVPAAPAAGQQKGGCEHKEESAEGEAKARRSGRCFHSSNCFYRCCFGLRLVIGFTETGCPPLRALREHTIRVLYVIGYAARTEIPRVSCETCSLERATDAKVLCGPEIRQH